MPPDQIAAWAGAGESETLEFKRSTGERREAARTLCAMLNNRGGRVLFGVETGGRVVGQQVSDHTVEEVAQELREIDPPTFPTIDRVQLGNGRGALANAFCHRDYAIGGGSVGVAVYDDRLEVTSSGTLHFGLTPEALFGPHESLPWNPLIAGVFYRRGIIESWGRGTLKMAELAAAAGLPRPEIEDLGGCVTVRFRPTRYVPPQRVGREISERQRAILALLHESVDGLALREVHARVGTEATDRQVREDLATLRALGLAISSGHGRGSLWKLK